MQSALQADRSAGYPNYFNKKLEVDAARPAIDAASTPLSGVRPAHGATLCLQGFTSVRPTCPRKVVVLRPQGAWFILAAALSQLCCFWEVQHVMCWSPCLAPSEPSPTASPTLGKPEEV